MQPEEFEQLMNDEVKKRAEGDSQAVATGSARPMQQPPVQSPVQVENQPTMQPMMQAVTQSMEQVLVQPQREKLKMSNKMVFATLGIAVVAVVATCALISVLTHPSVTATETSKVVEIVPVEKTEMLDKVVEEYFGVVVKDGVFEAGCVDLSEVGGCNEFRSTVYGLISDHQIVGDTAYAFLKLGEQEINSGNLDDFPTWRIKFHWNDGEYNFVEIKQL